MAEKEYIERGALRSRNTFGKEDILLINGKTFVNFDRVMDAIVNIPTADVVEVRHGEWLPSRNGINPIRCNKCNTPALFVQEQDGFGGFGFYRHPSNYCPYCGAKMDGKGEN